MVACQALDIDRAVDRHIACGGLQAQRGERLGTAISARPIERVGADRDAAVDDDIVLEDQGARKRHGAAASMAARQGLNIDAAAADGQIDARALQEARLRSGPGPAGGRALVTGRDVDLHAAEIDVPRSAEIDGPVGDYASQAEIGRMGTGDHIAVDVDRRKIRKIQLGNGIGGDLVIAAGAPVQRAGGNAGVAKTCTVAGGSMSPKAPAKATPEPELSAFAWMASEPRVTLA